jgi:hypothetical protein
MRSKRAAASFKNKVGCGIAGGFAAADQRNLRMPTGAESGANTLFVPGGYTSGGVPEAEIDPIPENRVSGRERCVAG